MKDKTKEELTLELQELQREHNSLKVSYEKDIAGGKQAEEALRESKEKYRNLFEQSPETIIIVGLDGKILDYNHEQSLIGFSREKLIGKNVSDLKIDFKDKFASIEKGNTEPYIMEVKTQSGDSIWLEIHPSKITESNNISLRFMVRNITKRKQATDALLESEEKYRTLSTNIPGMIYRGRPDWSAEIISNSEIVCGYRIDEFNTSKLNWIDLIHADDKQWVSNEGSKLTKEPMSIVQEYRIIAKDKSTIWVSDHKTSFFNSDGSFIGIDGIVYNINERKQIVNKLKDSEEEYRNRTKELNHANKILKKQNIKLVQIDKLIKLKNKQLDNKNVTLNELMSHVAQEKENIEEKVHANIEKLILPFLNKLKTNHNDNTIQTIKTIEYNLNNIVDSYGYNLTNKLNNLSPREVEICNYIKTGLRSKEISKLLHISETTVISHRNHIRRKFKINNTKINLTTYLNNL